jgi:hypothetical protein
MRALRSLIPRRGALAQLASLRWAALPVTNRRWTLPMSAIALGLGLFIGVAIGPGISTTLGTSPLLVVTGPPASAPAHASSAAGGTGGSGGAPEPNGQVGPSQPAHPGAGIGVAAPGPAPSAGFPVPSVTPVAPTSIPPASIPPTSIPPTATTSTETDTSSDETESSSVPPDDTSSDLVVKGTVIHVNPLASSYVVSSRGGQMNAIHARQLPRAGAKLEVPVRKLANGTYAEDGDVKRAGSAKSALFRGIVTFADPTTGAYSVSSKGVSLLVHANSDESPSPPRVGARLAVTARLGPPPDDTANAPPPPATPTPAPPTTPSPTPPAGRPAGCGAVPPPPHPPKTSLTELSRVVQVASVDYSHFEGIVQGVCGRKLVLSADDLRESAADIELPLAKGSGIALSSISPGDVVDASGTIHARTAALSLTGISSDDGIKGADDSDLRQGDQSS